MKTQARPRARSKRGQDALIREQAVRAVIQILFVTRRAYTVDSLREKLREFFLEEADYEKRAVASISTVELVTGLIEASPTLASLGLQVRLHNGVAQLATIKVATEPLDAFFKERAERVTAFSQAALEVLACVGLKGPISQSEIDALFGRTDKRHLVFVLREAGMIEALASDDGRLRYVTTGAFLQHFGLSSLTEFKTAWVEAQAQEERARSSQMGFLL